MNWIEVLINCARERERNHNFLLMVKMRFVYQTLNIINFT